MWEPREVEEPQALCLLEERGHQITARTIVLHSKASLKWAGSGGERLAEASGGLPGVHSALTEHATAEWLESMRGNEKLVATQPEPRVAFDAGRVWMRAREKWWRGEGWREEERGGEERRGRTMSDEFKNIKHLEKILLIGCITGVYLQSKHRERWHFGINCVY